MDLISTDVVDSLGEVTSYKQYAGGAVSNLATNLTRLGYPTSLGACLGNDGLGLFLQNHLSQTGVNIDLLQITDLAPTTLIPITRQSGTPDFSIYRGADQYLSLNDQLLAAAADSRFIHTSAFALSRNPCRSTILAIFEAFQGSGKIISLDPNYHPGIWPDLPDYLSSLKEFFKFITVTKPSLDDSKRIFGPDLKPIQYLENFLELGPEIVVLTLGSEGSLLGTSQGEMIHLQPNPVQVVDITGAGDALWSGLLAGLFEGYPPLISAQLGQAVAENKIGYLGPVREIHSLKAFLDIAEKTKISMI